MSDWVVGGYGLENDTVNQQNTLIKCPARMAVGNLRLVFVWVNVEEVNVNVLKCYIFQGIYQNSLIGITMIFKYY